MLPMTKNIFHLLGDDAHSRSKTAVAVQSVAVGRPEPADSRRPKLQAHPQVPEGLRILLIQQRADQRGETSSHIVIKSSLNRSSSTTTTTLRRRPDPKVSSPELGLFLKTCFLCKKELSPHKDVYMYRGDQGYCSPECRSRQILSDERRELSHGHRNRATGSKIRASAQQNHRILLAA